MSNRTCSVQGCGNPHSARGFCGAHYQKWLKYGDPLGCAPPRQTGCNFPGCDKPFESKGYCSAHARQLRDGVELHGLRTYWHGASCLEEGCDEPILAKGRCRKHWAKQNYHTKQRPFGPVRRPGPRVRFRRWTLNATYFDNIATPDQAYWLGFAAADGTIIDTPKTRCLRVELAASDDHHLARMALALGSDQPVRYYRTGAVVTFESKQLVESLRRVGLGPRKSFTVEPWDGPAQLMPHYWRGLFDGDGSVYRVGSRSEEWTLNLVGSQPCVEAFAAWAKAITGSRAMPQRKPCGIWTWAVQGRRSPQILATALYADAPQALPRKLERAQELMAVDFDALLREANVRRSVNVRESWRSGRHGRSKKRAA